MKPFKLGVYQGKPVTGNMEATLQLMEEIITAAGQQHVQLLVFPELFVTGYSPELWEYTPTSKDEEQWMKQIALAARRSNVWVICGHPSVVTVGDEGRDRKTGWADASTENLDSTVLTDAASLISPEGVIGTYSKVHLFGLETETFARGTEFPVWTTPFGKIGIQLCYDIEFPEAARVAALHGAEILINPANNMTPFAAHHYYFTMARAIENTMFVATVNRVGWENDVDFCGGTCVAHPNGTWLLRTNREEGLFVTEIDTSDRNELDPSVQYLKHRQTAVYDALTKRH